jgi:hypothetical protein
MTEARNYVKAFSFPLMVYAVLSMVVVYDRFFHLNSFVSEAVSIDLILTAPLVYLFASWKLKTKSMLVFPLAALGFTLGYFFLRGEHEVLNTAGRIVFPALEIVSVASIFLYARKFYSNSRALDETDIYTIIKKSTKAVFGNSRLSEIFATEFAVIWFGLISWKRKRDEKFTCYKENNSLILYGFFIFILLAETFVFHLMLIGNYPVFTWILTGTSIYFVIQILAHAKAIYLRYNELLPGRLLIRYGLAGDATISYRQISNISCKSEFQTINRNETARFGLLKSLEQMSVLIELKEPVAVESFYGIRKNARVLLIPVDHAREFVQQVQEKISHLQ